jgi:Fe(3+) dicitrate transport protein
MVLSQTSFFIRFAAFFQNHYKMNMPIRIFLFLALVTTVSQAFSQGNDTTYQTTEVSIVAKRGQRLPGSGEIIDSKKLALLNQPDVNKVLRTVPGVQIRDEEGFGLRPNIGMRATAVNRSAKITLMEDGILAAPAPYADPSAYYFPTFARMEAVEVLKGSSQIKYGPYTIGGALNLISTSIPDSLCGLISASYGSFGTNQERIWVGNSGTRLDYVFDVNRLASNGFKVLDNGGKTGFDRRDIMGKIRWHSDATAKIKQSLTFKFVHMSEASKESYLGLTYSDFIDTPYRRYAATQMDYLDLEHQDARLTYQSELNKYIRMAVTAYYGTTYRDWSRVNKVGGVSLNNILSNPQGNQTAFDIMTGNADGVVDFQSAVRRFQSQGVQASLNLHKDFKHGQIEWETGVRSHRDEADRMATNSYYQMVDGWMTLDSTGVKGNAENQIRSAESFSGYSQVDYKIGAITLSPGIRYERISLLNANYGVNDNARWGNSLVEANNDLEVWLPGFGLTSQMDKGTVFAGLHKGFSPPGTPVANSTNGQASTEQAINYELGYRLRLNAIKAQVALFYSDYSNLLGSDNISGGGAGTGNSFNAGAAQVYGAEVNADLQLFRLFKLKTSDDLNLQLAYTFTDARFAHTFTNAGGDWGSGLIEKGDRIPFITPHTATAVLTYVHKRWNATVVTRYIGETRTKPGTEKAIIPGDEVAYGDVNSIASSSIVDLSCNFRVNKNWSAFAMVNNVLDQAYIVANLPQSYRPGIARSVMVGFKYNIRG